METGVSISAIVPRTMTGELILKDTFFAFWHSFGEYFVLLIAFGLIVSTIIAIIYILTKR